MRINTNTWNRIRYTLSVPAYDRIVRFVGDSRAKSVASLQVQRGDKVLIIGAGTGLDLQYLPHGCDITAIDLTPAMIRRIEQRSRELSLDVRTQVMDAQALTFPDETFDKIILHLILAVIPDPVACIREASRVLKKGGEVVVFDKFVPKGRKISMRRRFANFFTNIFATSISRSFETIVCDSGLTVISDEDANWKGNFRLIKLRKV